MANIIKVHHAGEEYGIVGASKVAVEDLEDTNITNPTDGQVLKYDASSSKWINSTDANTNTISGLDDTTITTPTNGQVLKYDATTSKWINAESSEGQIIQVDTMPVNPEQNRIVQYVGATNANYTNGYFYKAGELVYDESVATMPVADHLAPYNGKVIYVEDEQKTYAVSTTTAVYPCLGDDDTPGVVTLGWVMDLVPGATIFAVDMTTTPDTPLDTPIGTVDSIGRLVDDTQRYNCTLNGESRELYAKNEEQRPTGTKYVATESTTYGWVRVDVQPGGSKDSDIAFTTINMTGREVTFNNNFITNSTLVSYTITSGGIPAGTLTASVDTGSVTFESTENETSLQLFVKFEKTNSNSMILS